MRRIISLWFPNFPTDRLKLSQDEGPTVIVARNGNGLRVRAACLRAQQGGVREGLSVAEARALLPDLCCVADAPEEEARDLARLADWARCYTPLVAVDNSLDETGPAGVNGLWLDVTGCPHLFGGEAALLETIQRRLRGFGLAVRAGLADTAGLAWAAAHVKSKSLNIVPSGRSRTFLAPLPVAALRLPAATLEALDRVGLRRIEDLMGLPRAPLTARFGSLLGRRLDQALGLCAEPLSPRLERPPLRARLAFPEPIGSNRSIIAALASLLDDLCRQLTARNLGARRLDFRLYRVDGAPLCASVGAHRPARDAARLLRLFQEAGLNFDLGFGIEAVTLDATEAETFIPLQQDHIRGAQGGESLAHLLDRLCVRLGPGRVVRLAPLPRHLPEHAWRPSAPLALTEKSAPPPILRPLRLLAPPEPLQTPARIEKNAVPTVIYWRGATHHVARAEGPERIAPDWWRRGAKSETRDYYRLETRQGRRLWVYRRFLPSGPTQGPSDWYLHGEFA